MTIYQQHIGLGELIPENFRHEDQRARMTIFLRRVAREIAYGTYMLTDPGQHSPGGWPGHQQKIIDLSETLMENLLTGTGMDPEQFNNSHEEYREWLMRTVRVGLRDGWQLAKEKHPYPQEDVTP